MIAIIGILLGLLLPNLAAVQQTAKAGTQAATIQGFGKGFMDFSTLDSQGRLSSGAFDHMRDGDMTKVGWVADLVNGKLATPGKSLDPMNRHRVNVTFSVASGATNYNKGLYDWPNQSRWANARTYSGASINAQGWGSTSTSLAVKASTYFGSSQTVWDDGYNTNFATTWHLSRGDNIVNEAGFEGLHVYNGAENGCEDDPHYCPLDGDGPLSAAHLADSSLLTSADKIALLGPAQTASNSDYDGDSTALTSAEAEVLNRFVDPTGRRRIVKNGDFTLESFTSGPIARVAITGGAPGVTAAYISKNDAANKFIHEIGEIAPHAKAKKVVNAANPSGVLAGGYANILFADGSVRRVNDSNGYGGANKGDGWIGPFQLSGRHEPWRLDFRYNVSNAWNYEFDNGAYDEVRDELYLGRLRVRLAAGGGSAE